MEPEYRAAGVFLVLPGLMVLVPASVSAQEYPEKPIPAIVAFNSGGGTHVSARVILKYAEKYPGGTFVEEFAPVLW